MTERDDGEQVYLAALAGLLHDIGKFAQRAGWGSGRHTEVGGEVVRQYVPEPWREGLYPVMGHHDCELLDRSTRVVALADRLSAGERIDEACAQPQHLQSIFCGLRTANGEASPPRAYWPLSPLRLDEMALFPGDAPPEAATVAAYGDLWTGFERELAALRDAHADGEDLPVYLETLQLLLARYTWCVPSAYYRSVPDVSLYDHSRTTAALTACLAAQPDAEIGALLEGLSAWHRAGDESEPPPALTETDVALLVGGDISGVQSFIYTITARGATSALRGRSFYLQLLTEAVVRYILRELGLPMTNLIYQGGGRFYLLAPPDAALRLREIQRFISEILLKHHDGDLYLAVAWEALKAADFYGGRIAAAWDGVGAGLQRAKQRRFSELGEGLTALFAPRGHGGNEESQCQVCGREHTDIKVEADTRKCAACRAYEALGKDLRRARYLWLETLDPGAETPAGGWGRVLAELGLRAGVSEEIPGRAGGRRVLLALDDAAMAGLSPRPHTAVGRRFLVNVTPIIQDWEIADLRDRVDELPEPGSVKPFSALAAQAQGIDRLGVLRMDVDNLGVLFAEGFPKGTRSLSRLAALSFAVSLFFEGWVGALAETVSREARSDKRGDTLYAIYSGGDDLFFVGAWDVVVTLAQRIRADLGRFAAGHPAVHASAGIALIGGKYPLYQAAEDAGEAEGKAKSLVWTNADGHVRRKDAIAFLDVALPWPRFGYGGAGGDTVTGLQRTLVAHRDAGMPHSVLRTLLQLYADYRQAAEARAKRGEDRTRTGEPQALWGPWIWRGFYRLKREGKRYPEIEALAERLHDDWFQALPWAGVAARWAELLLR